MSVLEHFKTICTIPHCSSNAERLKEFLISFAKERGYDVEIDEKNNILAYGGSRNIAFQAHYDMVCVGKAPNIKLVYEDQYFRIYPLYL